METTNEALPAAAIQIVVLLFFSTSLGDAQEVSSLVEVQRLQSTILIFISIILSLWSVGNGTRKYCAFIGKFNKPIWYYYGLALYTATGSFPCNSTLCARISAMILDGAKNRKEVQT